MASGLTKDTKGYYVHTFRLLTHPLSEVMTVIPVPPLLLLVDYVCRSSCLCYRNDLA
jgi:hypothetical protein